MTEKADAEENLEDVMEVKAVAGCTLLKNASTVFNILHAYYFYGRK